MSPLVALGIGLLVGALVGALVAALLLRRPVASGRAEREAGDLAPSDAALSRRLIELMDPAVVLLDGSDAVVLANRAAQALGVVRGPRVVVPELMDLAHVVRAEDDRRADVELPGDLGSAGPRLVGVHGLRLAGGAAAPVALVLQDVTEARRVEAVRRDFVANVGHELKTPVGALGLLAEAMQGAADDPEAVQRFASRMAHEADRLARLVRELIDLSRLQGAEPLPELAPVDVDGVLADAVYRTGPAADAKGIEIAVGGQAGLLVRGVEGQLATAVTNLLANAVVYSPEHTKIAVAARARSGFVEIAVTDSGIGIPRQDRARVFERFYRVDQSRASSTGGTGLGLAIVKHVATNHGGSVSVWSEEGLGSTFTLRIPLAASTTGQVPAARAAADAVPTDAVGTDSSRGRS